MCYEQKQFTKRTVTNSNDAATRILSGLANNHEALHWQDQKRDFICIPNGTNENPFSDLTLLEKRGSVFIEIKDISIEWMKTNSVLALHLYAATRQRPACSKPALDF